MLLLSAIFGFTTRETGKGGTKETTTTLPDARGEENKRLWSKQPKLAKKDIFLAFLSIRTAVSYTHLTLPTILRV